MSSNSETQETIEARIDELETRLGKRLTLQTEEIRNRVVLQFEFPTYDGSVDPFLWLHRCEKFFWIQKIAEIDKVGLAIFHLTGEVELWSSRVERQKPNQSRELFKGNCRFRFGPSPYSTLYCDLLELKQTGSVAEYPHQFQNLLAHNDLVCLDQEVGLFTLGLTKSIRSQVEMRNPPTLSHAMHLARAFERKERLSPAENWWQGNCMEPPIIRKLTCAEMEERLAKNLCFNCDKLWCFNYEM